VVRDLGLKEPYVGSCALQTGEIGDDLTYYFTASEQVPSAVGLGVLMDRNNTVRTAGGFIIQLMPYTSDEVITKLEKKLSAITSVTSMLDRGMTPEDILQEILGEFEPELLEKTEVSYRCDCSRERIERALISIGRKELREMIDEGKSIETGCQFCGKKYSFSVEELKKLLTSADRP
jgi:molecular chaperone Hsp33